MKRTVALLTAALLAAAFAPKTAEAAARCAGVQPQSIFGTVTAVRGNIFTVHMDSSARRIDVNMPDNDVRTVAGASLRPGVFAGVFGCVPPGSGYFYAEEVTLSPTEASYPSEYRYANDERVIYGRIDHVAPGRIYVHSTEDRDMRVMTNQSGFSNGQTVKVVGRLEPGGVLIARHITVEP